MHGLLFIYGNRENSKRDEDGCHDGTVILTQSMSLSSSGRYPLLFFSVFAATVYTSMFVVGFGKSKAKLHCNMCTSTCMDAAGYQECFTSNSQQSDVHAL